MRRSLLAAAVAAALLVAGCGSSGHPKAAAAAGAVTITGQNQNVALPGGGTLTLNSGSLPAGTTLKAAPDQAAPAPDSQVHWLTNPVALNLTERPNCPFRPRSASRCRPGRTPACWSSATTTRTSACWDYPPVTVSADGRSISAQLNSFSSVSLGELSEGVGQRIVQDWGELFGSRTSGPQCVQSGTPSWVGDVNVTNDAGQALRGCTRSAGNTLVIELTNNRPYGVVLSLGARRRRRPAATSAARSVPPRRTVPGPP